MLQAIRHFLVMNAAPEQVGLPGAGWKVGMVTNGAIALAWLVERYSASASTIVSSR